MYFILRHSENSNYKDIFGEIYHYTERSPNSKKLKEGSKVLLYKKENNSIIAFGKVVKIEVKNVNNQKHFFAYLKCKRFKEPIFCDYRILKLAGIKFQLDSALPGIIPISRASFQKILKLFE